VYIKAGIEAWLFHTGKQGKTKIVLVRAGINNNNNKQEWSCK